MVNQKKYKDPVSGKNKSGRVADGFNDEGAEDQSENKTWVSEACIKGRSP